jgi:hypothetical protein
MMDRTLSGPTAGGSGAWPFPNGSCYCNNKSKTAIKRSFEKPWPKPAPAEQNCSPLFLEQFWLRSGGRLQPLVGRTLKPKPYRFVKYATIRCKQA